MENDIKMINDPLKLVYYVINYSLNSINIKILKIMRNICGKSSDGFCTFNALLRELKERFNEKSLR